MPYQEATAKLQALMRRQDRVLTVMHPPSVALARVMEAAGAEAGFVGTSGVIGSYTGMEDVGTASMPECVMIGGWIARAVSFPVILDGDTGHGMHGHGRKGGTRPTSRPQGSERKRRRIEDVRYSRRDDGEIGLP